MKFKVKSPYQPAGDQAQAIEKLSSNLRAGEKHQVLLGVTGSGKTFTVAKAIENLQRPTLVISHNKTLAAQLYQEFKEFFSANAVGYFVSYYDYYLPEAYIPQTDTYIAKESDINEEIDKLRLQATSLLFSRSDVVIVASVSCIYNLGSPLEYGRYVIELEIGQRIGLDELLEQLVSLHYERTRFELNRSQFRLRGEVLEVLPAYNDEILKISWKNGQIESLLVRPVFGRDFQSRQKYLIYPAKHFLTNPQVMQSAFTRINEDLRKQLSNLRKQKKLLEAYRLEQRVNYDLAIIKETGYVNGIENYSRYFDGREPGEPPWTLIDYFHYLFENNFLVIIDESHMTVPQLRGMFEGDLSRKKLLIDFGFRLPSCLDNRPLKFGEILNRLPQVVYVSATPAIWEVEKSKQQVVEQLIRPTGLVDPKVTIRSAETQISDLVKEILKVKCAGGRVLVTTLTKRTAEELANWLAEPKNTGEPILVHYLHADVATLERSDILADLRMGKYDVVVGINLLREGLDLPEVALVAILDADQQGFLRSKTALIQTMGRAARNAAGEVILYADQTSEAMREAIKEVDRRRKIQLEYNSKHGITPKSIQKPIRERIAEQSTKSDVRSTKLMEVDFEALTPGEKKKLLPRLKREMRQAAAALEFEKAVEIRDLIERISL